VKKLTGIAGVHAVSLIAEDKGILENNGAWVPAYVKGVDENFTNVTGVARTLERGNFSLGTGDHPQAILGSGIANTLGVEAEKDLLPLSVYLFRRGSTDYSTDPMASMNHEPVMTSGMFRIQQDFDEHYVITNIEFVKRLVGLGPDEYSGAEVSIPDPRQVPAIKEIIARQLGNAYKVQTRYQQNQGLYSVMSTEKWVIYIVLTLILIVAAFNMVGALTMLVWEKQKDIHVLKALGANDGMIQRIFLSEGLLLALMGGIGGIVLAAVICLLQIKYKLVPLQGGSFLIDYYPVKLVATDFLLVLVTIGVIALLASWLPARKAAGQPVSLR